jgi:hypothetical protein
MELKPNQPILVMASIETYFYLKEPMMRFELMTSSLPRKRSTPELHRQNPLLRNRQLDFKLNKNRV